MSSDQITHVSLDLETLGTRPGCKVISIGACVFGPAGLGAQFYVEIHREFQGGLVEDPGTVEWWSRQVSEAKRVLVPDENRPILFGALKSFNNFISNISQVDDRGKRQAALWGNGSDFDNAILQSAYAAVSLEPVWPFYLNRCYRTLKSLAPHCKLTRRGTHHNALDDAVSQAEHAVRLFEELNMRRKSP